MGDGTGGPGAPDPSRPLWAGGFAGPPDPGMWAYTSSLAVDRRLWRQDVAGSRAHVRGLVAAGVLEEAEGKLLLDGLAQVRAGRPHRDTNPLPASWSKASPVS